MSKPKYSPKFKVMIAEAYLNEESRQHQESAGKAQRISKKIGNTTCDVSFHYSRQSRESMNDKIIRLIENNMQGMKNN